VFLRRLSLLVALFATIAGCEAKSSCALTGTWEVERLGCTDHPDKRRIDVNATYTFEGTGGTTRWVLPGCTVEAEFDLVRDGTEMKIHERQHTCEVTEVAEGVERTPCCTSSAVDVALSYRCQAGSAGVDWMATLREAGEIGPWADRGPWRGCPTGSLGMMRLVKH
jgi:hypothetical protein